MERWMEGRRERQEEVGWSCPVKLTLENIWGGAGRRGGERTGGAVESEGTLVGYLVEASTLLEFFPRFPHPWVGF